LPSIGELLAVIILEETYQHNSTIQKTFVRIANTMLGSTFSLLLLIFQFFLLVSDFLISVFETLLFGRKVSGRDFQQKSRHHLWLPVDERTRAWLSSAFPICAVVEQRNARNDGRCAERPALCTTSARDRGWAISPIKPAGSNVVTVRKNDFLR